MTGKQLLLSVLGLCLLCLADSGAGESPAERRKEAKRQAELGNYADAAAIYSRLALDPANTAADAGDDLGQAIEAMRQVGTPVSEEFLDQVRDAWKDSWRMKGAVAKAMLDLPQTAYMVDGKYVRTNEWRNNLVNSAERDRAGAINLMLEAETLLDSASDKPTEKDAARFYADFADIVASGRWDRAEWLFTSLTDLENLPDYESINEYHSRRGMPAPVDADRNPVYYPIPKSWAEAKNDGERWRWLLGRMAEVGGENGRDAADAKFANFLRSQFGVETLDGNPARPLSASAAGADAEESGPLALRTLTDRETIARLANGVRRFTLPDEFNYLIIAKRLASGGNPYRRAIAYWHIATTYENRQQYDKALEAWKDLLKIVSGDNRAGYLESAAKRKISEDDYGNPLRAAEEGIRRITGRDGRLEPGPIAPAGTRPSIPYLFRNGDKVKMTVQRLDEKRFLADIRSALKRPTLDLERGGAPHPERIGWALLEKGGEKYLAEKTAEWEVALNPKPGHYSSRQFIELPVSLAGAYLVTAEMAGGNTSRAVVWLADLALVSRNSYDRQVFYVADAVTGEPVGDATLSFLGYRNVRSEARRRWVIDTREFAEKADADGLAVLDAEPIREYGWLITADTLDGRLAYLGFEHVWVQEIEMREAGRSDLFVITDRPVYRPDQTVNYKFWLGKASYTPTPGADAAFARVPLAVEIRSPNGEVVHRANLTTDAVGGAAGSLTLGADAQLGMYHLLVGTLRSEGGKDSPTRATEMIDLTEADEIDVLSSGWFRLEEYKKPEFEVKVDAPAEALALGDSAQVKVNAKYYFGAPVTDAKVKYKVLRTARDERWFPPWRWDWLYGGGAWWPGYDYDWYPGWSEWGMARPRSSWMPPRYMGPPELVAEGEGKLDADGVFRLLVDSAPAKALQGDSDHQYEITVEVTDRSRRTIVGTGRVIAARKPFTTSVWANRGYYLAGEDIDVGIRATQPLGGGVKASGKATLHRVRYDAAGNPMESEESTWDVSTDADGSAKLRLRAAAPGQYRLSCLLADAKGRKVEGAVVLTVRGEKGEGDFRFAPLELVPDKNEYRPGDTLKLAVNADNRKAVVLLFPRAERNGAADPARAKTKDYARPRLIRLENGTATVPLDIGTADQPNFFCEAITISNGKIRTETREIFVPPAEKALTLEVTPDADSYLPGGKARFAVKATDADGKPVAGQIVVSMYDKSVEYISGGSNVPDIRRFFWSWKRYHRAAISTNLNRRGYGVAKEGDVSWEPIGLFGNEEADWNDESWRDSKPVMARAGGGGETITRRLLKAPSMIVSSASGALLQVPMEANAYSAEALPPPPASPAPAMMALAETSAAADMAVATGGNAGMAEPTVRSEFADTALWVAALETDADGKAEFTVDMPQNLTAWKARTWMMAPGVRVGEGEAQVETRKNVLVRPQAPRFLTQKDRAVLSANLHNYLPRAKKARVELSLEGGVLEPVAGTELAKSVELAANGEARVDWEVVARRPGTATLVMKLLTDEESDAAEVKLPVIVHGARRVESFGGVIAADRAEAAMRVTVPAERLPDQSRFELTFSPTLASAMLSALPYMIEYPYGCTEQTLNRFLPAVMTRRYLERLGASLADAEKMGDPAGADPASRDWRKRFGDPRGALRASPVFDDAKLDAMVKEGIERLANMRNPDGGWGWFSGEGERSWPHTTAVVVHGLLAARDNGAAVPPALLADGLEWLSDHEAAEVAKLRYSAEKAASGEDEKKDDRDKRKEAADNLDAFIRMTLAKDGRFNSEMREFLHRDRLKLSLSGMAMLGLALHAEKARDQLDIVRRNLAQYIERDPSNQTAWLRVPRSGWWWWYNDDIETQAWYLKFITRLFPKGDDAAGVAKYLLMNRKNGSYWRSTRDSAYAVEALAEFAVASGETAPDLAVSVYYDGNKVMERTIRPENLLDDNRFVLEGLAVETGEHDIRIVKSGTGKLYHAASLSLFSLEDPIRRAGGEIAVNRTFYRLDRDDRTAPRPGSGGAARDAAVESYKRVRIPSPFDARADSPVAVKSGDLIEVELAIDSKNDYEYLVFEDMKAAGLEAVELVSGYAPGRLGAYVEYRDQKVVLFVRDLPRGQYTMTYRFRAETPGRFSALPAFGGGMYATDLFANSDEMKIEIGDE